MNNCLRQCWEKLKPMIDAIYKFYCINKKILCKLYNKNIYTRILFTNITIFSIGLIALIMFSSSVVNQTAYGQAEQDLLRKAKRVNFALLRKEANQAWKATNIGESTDYVKNRQKISLKFFADSFDTIITIFDKQGNIIETSVEQEVVPGSKVDEKYLEVLTKGETFTSRKIDTETAQMMLVAVIPMGNNENLVENGILLESQPSTLVLAFNKMRLYLVIGGMIILVIFIFASVNLANHISGPISQLATTVAESSRGEAVLNTGDQYMDEINALSCQLNKLTERQQKMQVESSKMEEERGRLFGEISHELRTPLTSVQGFVEAIRDGMVKDGALQEKYLDTIYIQTLHINRLVDDLMILSRLESGNITVEKTWVDLIALAKGVAMSMESEANSKNNSILLEKKTENAIVLGDVDRLEQIIRNLLKNAIRATNNGSIKLGIEVWQGEVLLTIKDNGIGISSEDLRHIWDRFYRVKNQRDNLKERGSGLGLVIVKKLVQMQDGSIDVISQPGEGTTFNIKFPSFNQKGKWDISYD